MAAFSLGTVWEETIAFLRREGHLLVPVALALYGPAQILLQLGMLAMTASLAKPGSSNPETWLVVPSMLLMLFGNLSITRLALVPATSVGEALGASLRRLPTAVAASMLLFLALFGAVMVILIAATLGSMTSGTDPRASGMTGPLMLLVSIPVTILIVRLMMLMPVLAMEQEGTIATIRRTWALGRGNGLRFFGVFCLSLAINFAVATLNMLVIGSLAGMLRMLVGAEIVTVLQLVVSGALGALLMLGLTVYVALIYRKLAGTNPE